MPRLAVLAVLLLVVTVPARAQGPGPAAEPLRFESWRWAGPSVPAPRPGAIRPAEVSTDRTRRALVGGAIGAAAGVVFCTAVSSLVNDSAKGGLSFCPLDSYLLIGGAGFALGAIIGWVT